MRDLKNKLKSFAIFGALLMICLPTASSHAACPDGITSYWKLNETAGPTYNDVVGENDGTGNSNPTAAGGTVGGAQLFIPAEATGIDVPASRSFNWHGSDSFSIEFWVNVANSVSGGNHVALGRFEGNATNSGVFWFAAVDGDTGVANISMEDTENVSASLTGTTDLRDSTWHHIVVVHDDSLGAAGTLLLYVDGAVQDSAEVDYTGGFLSTSAPLSIGWFDFAGGFYFDGLIDEVALYERALPQVEIQNHHTAGLTGEDYCEGSAAPSNNAAPFPDGIISLWSLDEMAGPDYLDSYDANDGTGNSDPTAADGTVEGAQLFNPTETTGIDVSAHRSFDWLGSESFSIEFWVNVGASVSGGNHVALGRFEDNASNNGVFWFAAVDGDTGVANVSMEDTQNVDASLTGTTNLRDDAWHHIVVVHDNSLGTAGTLLLYIDGTVEDSVEVDYTGGFLSNSAPLTIGWFDFSGGFYFDGMLDEVALYERALPQVEIQDHHTTGLSGISLEAAQPAPVAVAAASQTSVKELVEVTLDGTGSADGDNNITSYLWEQTAGTPAVTINNANTATATFTPPDVDADTLLTFQLTVTDQDGQFSTATVDITVINRTPPNAAASDDQGVAEGASVTLNGSGSSDADGTIVSYVWTETSASGVTIVDDDPATPTATFIAPDVTAAGATLEFELTVTDNDGLTATDSVNVTVSNIASPLHNPVAVAGNTQGVSAGDTVTLNGSGSSDADGTIVSYVWTETSASGVTIVDDDPATPTATFIAPNVTAGGETLMFELTVTDNDGLTATDSVSVTVSDITSTLKNPVAAAGNNQSVSVGASVTLDGTGSSDSDGTVESYLWEQTAGISVVLTGANADTTSFTVPNGAAGQTLKFQLTVTDNDSLESSDSVSITVIESDQRSEIDAFVTRFYQLCLDREPDAAGLQAWVDALINGTLTGSDVAKGFVFSSEFLNKNTPDDEYVQILYRAFFDREPDPAGKQGWLDALTSGASREDVLNGFIFAPEFAQLSDQYGIKAFEGHITKAQREAVTTFVTRFYQLCLNRGPDAAGLQTWADNLLAQIQTGADVANGFIFSPEFIAQNTTDDEFLTILYRAFFNREPDQAGKDGWQAELTSGQDRGVVLNGFLGSQEFITLCEGFGITPF